MRLEVQNHQRQPILINGDDLLEDPVNEVLELLERGIQHAKNGKKSEARKDLLRVTEKDSQNEDAWMWLASISDYPEELLVFLQNVLRINPENARAIQWTKSTKSLLAKTFVQRGIDSSKEDRKDFAKQCFLQAIANDDRNELAWMWLASVTENLEEKALHLNKAISINSGNQTAREALASVNKLLGIPDAVEREVAASNASKLDLALLEKAAKELACPFCEAPKFFDTIVCTSCDSLQSLDDTDALFDHADAKREVLEKAIEKFEAEKTQRELSAIELVNLGIAYFNVKNPAHGVATLEQALSKEPGNFPLETSLALIKSRLAEVTTETKDSTVSESAETSETAMNESPAEAVVEEPIEVSAVSNLETVTPDVTSPATNFGEEESSKEPEPDTVATPEVESASVNVEETATEPVAETSDETVVAKEAEVEERTSELTVETSQEVATATEIEAASREIATETENELVSTRDEEVVSESEAITATDDASSNSNVAELQSSNDLEAVKEETPASESEPNDETAVEFVEASAADATEESSSAEEKTESAVSETVSDTELTTASSELSECEQTNENSVATESDNSVETEPASEIETAPVATENIESNHAEETAESSVAEELSENASAEKQAISTDAAEIAESETAEENSNETFSDQLAESEPATGIEELPAVALTEKVAAGEVENESEEDAKTETPPTSSSDVPKTIMIVDENPTVRKLVAMKLKESGFNVLVASHGAEAITILDGFTPDLVLLDISLPHLDGYEVCQIMHETEAMKSVPVLLISEKKIKYDEEKASSVGASGHITKPFGPGALMKTISSFLS